MRGLPGAAKRGLDVLVSAAAMIVLMPVLLTVAVSIWITSGRPVLYHQTRVGLDGRRFVIFKFRTMAVDAEQFLGPIWAVPQDPRCIRIGHFLRRFGFDELPQLWNVLRGDMSLVGPRPERPEFTRELRKEHRDYDLRHMVRPGIVGYAQAYGWRGYTSLEERLRHDLYYVHNWSVFLDAYVLLRTACCGWSEKTRNGVPSES